MFSALLCGSSGIFTFSHCVCVCVGIRFWVNSSKKKTSMVNCFPLWIIHLTLNRKMITESQKHALTHITSAHVGSCSKDTWATWCLMWLVSNLPLNLSKGLFCVWGQWIGNFKRWMFKVLKNNGLDCIVLNRKWPLIISFTSVKDV